MFKPVQVKAVNSNRHYTKIRCFCNNCGCEITFGLPHPDIRKNEQYCIDCYGKLFPQKTK